MQETQETGVQSLGQEDSLEEDMATYSSVPAYKIHRQRTWRATVHVVTTDRTGLSTHMLTECMHLFLCLPHFFTLFFVFAWIDIILSNQKEASFQSRDKVLQQFSPYFSSQMTPNTTRILFRLLIKETLSHSFHKLIYMPSLGREDSTPTLIIF